MKNTILIVTLFCCSILAKAQGQSHNRSSTIKDFISAVFKDKKDARFVMDNFMYISPNDTIPKSKKERVIAAMLDTLVKRNSAMFGSSGYETYAYNDFEGSKKKFNTDDHSDIMILSVKNKPLIYFYFKKDRIMSFSYIDKGSLSFFITI